jgi:hypothetical protein
MAIWRSLAMPEANPSIVVVSQATSGAKKAVNLRPPVNRSQSNEYATLPLDERTSSLKDTNREHLTMNTEKLLVAARRRAELEPEHAAERIFGSLRTVTIEFDWEVPASAGDPIVFRVRISREGRESSIRFTIDLNRLQTDDLQALHDLLAYPPRDYWLARAVAWLVDASLRQQQPHWSDEQRNQKVREVLLAPP